MAKRPSVEGTSSQHPSLPYRPRSPRRRGVCVDLSHEAPDELLGIERMHELDPDVAGKVFADFRVTVRFPDDGGRPEMAACPPDRDHLKRNLVGVAFVGDQLGEVP